MMPQNRYYEDYRSTGHSTSPQGLAPATARALHQAHDSARRAFERGATVSRVFNWLQLYNNPAPSSGERSRERWNHEIGTRVGAAATSEAAIGPQLVSAMQGGDVVGSLR